MKRFLVMLFVFTLCVSTAYAELPQAIYPLDYDSLAEPETGVHHYLFACFDTWDYDANYLGNTDGMVLVTLDNNQNRIIFTSIMREFLVQRPDGKIGRITYIAKNYGPDALCRVVSTHFGVKVEKYIFFSMDNIQTIIDALGGVHITVTDAEARYLRNYAIADDATEPTMDQGGTYLFSGHAAVIYMRIRKVGGTGDEGRTERVRTVLKTLVSENQSLSLSDAVNLAVALTDNLCMTNLSMNEIMTALSSAYKLRGVAAEGFQLPVSEALDSISYAGMATNQVDFALCREAFASFLAPQEE